MGERFLIRKSVDGNFQAIGHLAFINPTAIYPIRGIGETEKEAVARLEAVRSRITSRRNATFPAPPRVTEGE